MFTGDSIAPALKTLVAFFQDNTNVDVTATSAYGIVPSGDTTGICFNVIFAVSGGVVDVTPRTFLNSTTLLSGPSNIIDNVAKRGDFLLIARLWDGKTDHIAVFV